MKSLNIEKAHYGENNFSLAKYYYDIGNVYALQGKSE
jgi:hypothetical protein